MAEGEEVAEPFQLLSQPMSARHPQDIRTTLQEAARALGLPPKDFELVSPYRYRPILVEIVDRFTRLGARRGLPALWWWEHFREPTFGIQHRQAYELLPRLVREDEKVWFVAENWGGRKKDGNFWLFEGRLGAIVAILAEAHAFEYYVVSRKLDWLLCENHHDVLIGTGEAIVKKMEAVLGSRREDV